jgi:hypothetical protein
MDRNSARTDGGVSEHERESNFRRADLQSVLWACGTMYVMVLAQFGTFSPRGDHTVDLRTMQKRVPSRAAPLSSSARSTVATATTEFAHGCLL